MQKAVLPSRRSSWRNTLDSALHPSHLHLGYRSLFLFRECSPLYLRWVEHEEEWWGLGAWVIFYIYATVALESCHLFILLRHRTPAPRYASPKRYTSPSPYRAYSSLSSGGKSVLLVKKKAPSRSGFLRSMHVVLKTRYVNPNIHVRRY